MSDTKIRKEQINSNGVPSGYAIVSMGSDTLTWVPISTVATIDDLGGVTITTPASGQALIYTGITWVNSEIAASGTGGNIATDSIWDAKGDLAVGTGGNTAVRLPAGTDGKYLRVASGETCGLKWDTPSSDGGGDFPTFVPWSFFEPDTLYIDHWYYAPEVELPTGGGPFEVFASFRVPATTVSGGSISVSALYHTEGVGGDTRVSIGNYVCAMTIDGSDHDYEYDGGLVAINDDSLIHKILPVTITVVPGDIIGLQFDRTDSGYYAGNFYFLGWVVDY